MIELIELERLKEGKNLLAFSGGTDSSALYNELSMQGIGFDMVIMDYGKRDQSKEEVSYAKELAAKSSKKIYIKEVDIQGYSNFEKRARDARYDYFDELMHDYDNLILGHNMSDKTEWFLMQFIRGTGLEGLSGMELVSVRKDYTIVRPLLRNTKEEVMTYLKSNNVKYFFDESNNDYKHERNLMRHEFSEKLLKDHSRGIRKTFDILQKEKGYFPKGELKTEIGQYREYLIEDFYSSNFLSTVLKQKGYLLSGPQREDFEEEDEITVVIDNVSVVATYHEGLLYISPYVKTKVPKKSRDNMRKMGIPPKHRPYYYEQMVKEEKES